jgi:hypothetical protein
VLKSSTVKNKRTILITGLVGILLILAGLFIYVNFFFGKYIKETVLEENSVISFDWKEIDTKNLAKIEKDKHYISILLEPPFEADTPEGGIKSPTGEIINPEIKLVDSEGNEYSLIYIGSRRYQNGEYANYGYLPSLPVDKIYKKVLVRSNKPIKVQKIIWSGYDIKDLK